MLDGRSQACAHLHIIAPASSRISLAFLYPSRQDERVCLYMPAVRQLSFCDGHGIICDPDERDLVFVTLFFLLLT